MHGRQDPLDLAGHGHALPRDDVEDTPPTLSDGAAGVGFEPTIEVAPDAGFQDRCVQPLRHPAGRPRIVEVIIVVGRETPAFSLIAVDDSPTDPALAASESGARPSPALFARA